MSTLLPATLVSDLYAENIDATPVQYAWSEYEYDSEWSIVYPELRGVPNDALVTFASDYLGMDVSVPDDPDGFDDLIDDLNPAMYEEPDLFVPVMSYYYPVSLRGTPEEAQWALVGLPVCVVEVGGEYVLALSGGGMDYRWEICEAYIRLGQLPPVHFCDLPAMSDRGDDDTDRLIIDACLRSLDVVRRNLAYTERDLRSLRKES